MQLIKARKPCSCPPGECRFRSVPAGPPVTPQLLLTGSVLNLPDHKCCALHCMQVPKPSMRCSCTNPFYQNSTSAEAPAPGPHAGYEVQGGSFTAAAPAALPTAEYQDERHGIPSTSGPAGPRDTSAYQELGHRQSWTSRGSRATHRNYHLQHPQQQHRHRQQQQHWEQDSGGFSYLPLDPLADAGSWLHQSEYLPPLEPLETQHKAAIQQQVKDKGEDGESSSATDGAHSSNSSSSSPSSSLQEQHGKAALHRDADKTRSNSKQTSSSSSRRTGGQGKAKQVTARIQQCTHWQQLEQLLQQHQQQLNHIHAAALLRQAAKVVGSYHLLSAPQQAGFAGLYSQLLMLTFDQLTAAGPREVASSLWAMAKLEVYPGEEWVEAYLAGAQGLLPGFSSQDLSSLAWALGKFRHAPGAGFMEAFYAAAEQQAGVLQGQALANLWWGLASMQQKQSSQQQQLQQQLGAERWSRSCFAASAGSLQQMGFQGLANTLWAVARLGFRPSSEWLAASCEVATTQLPSAKAAELSMLLQAYAKLGYLLPKELLQGLEAATQQQVGALRFVETANVLWSFAQLRVVPGVGWWGPVLVHLRDHMQEADAPALANTLTALRVLKRFPDALLSSSGSSSSGGNGTGSDGTSSSSKSAGGSWWEAVWAVLPQLLPQADAAAVASILLGCSKLLQKQKHRVPQQQLDQLLERGQQLLPVMSPSQLANVVYALAGLKAVPGREWLQQFEAVAAQQLRQMRPREAANILLALTRLKHRPSAEMLTTVEQLQGGAWVGMMSAVDKQQLQRAMQSIKDQERVRQRLEGAAAAAAPVPAAARARRAGGPLRTVTAAAVGGNGVRTSAAGAGVGEAAAAAAAGLAVGSETAAAAVAVRGGGGKPAAAGAGVVVGSGSLEWLAAEGITECHCNGNGKGQGTGQAMHTEGTAAAAAAGGGGGGFGVKLTSLQQQQHQEQQHQQQPCQCESGGADGGRVTWLDHEVFHQQQQHWEQPRLQQRQQQQEHLSQSGALLLQQRRGTQEEMLKSQLHASNSEGKGRDSKAAWVGSSSSSSRRKSQREAALPVLVADDELQEMALLSQQGSAMQLHVHPGLVAPVGL